MGYFPLFFEASCSIIMFWLFQVFHWLRSFDNSIAFQKWFVTNQLSNSSFDSVGIHLVLVNYLDQIALQHLSWYLPCQFLHSKLLKNANSVLDANCFIILSLVKFCLYALLGTLLAIYAISYILFSFRKLVILWSEEHRQIYNIFNFVFLSRSNNEMQDIFFAQITHKRI